MKNIHTTLLLILFFAQVISSSAQNGSQKIQVTDLTRIKQVVSVAASPDGTKAMYVLRTIEPNADNKLEYDYRNHLYLVDLQANAVSKALTRGSESISGPVFAPDGKSIAFVRAVKSKPQVFIMPLDGGEAWQLTDVSYGAGNPRFSPDGRKILFSVSLNLSSLLADTLLNPSKGVPAWSMEKPGFPKNEFLNRDKKIKPNPDGNLDEIRAYLDKDVEDRKAKVFNRLNFQGEAMVEPEISFNHLFVIEVKEGAKATPLTKGFWSYGQGGWSPDGQRIWAVTGKDRTQHPDREQESTIVSMNLNGGDEKTILAEKDKSFGGYDLSPDGKTLVAIMSTPNLLSFSQIVMADASGANLQTVAFDRTANGANWSRDGKYVYLTAPSNGGVPVYRIDAKTRKVEQLGDFESGVSAFDLTSSKVVYAKTDVLNPSDLYFADLTLKNPVQLTRLNEAWLKDKKLSLPEKRVYTNSKGQKVEYWIMKPSFMEAGKKYPLVLQLHGGPTAMWGPGEFSMWHEFQYFCSQGYGVVYPNQRGSGGYGKDFQFSNYRDWGPGPQEDALAACTDAAKAPWVDTSKQVITGGSYAGYLTAWIIAQDHRFKAAFAQRGVYDLTTFMGEGNAWRLVPNYFGLPWEDEKVTEIDAESPYSYVQKIRTPFLIKHGENDLRTGVIQSQMMFRSLKYLEKDVEYVLMPGGTHELSRSGNVRQRIDRMLRIYEFFERYIR
ncbi:S9 family peptidase [Haliscomenobacter hydrossis]|uniref:Peptidase S9 prolyl oligopeptidase active site domain protein n=1 Tax=Haliscomenobacter hydrossis (strain ATCC 27775 / DSM 1100 / LMG 10767 / O) TaxID=760192 RepID=F4L3W3_HALH1|nr:S9 family peptidase [Haliscomenobacter hydrossis]AEE48717.1 peptidase S9 prolyl oligopeptidase active site domain protein [Haliscomenobacter hydrossis DSM 1100]